MKKTLSDLLLPGDPRLCQVSEPVQNWQPQEWVVEDALAELIQHESDHLGGILAPCGRWMPRGSGGGFEAAKGNFQVVFQHFYNYFCLYKKYRP